MAPLTRASAALNSSAFCAVAASFFPLEGLSHMVNIGTLFAFVVVCAAVLVLRVTHPDTPRGYKAPFGLATPVLGIALCLLLMFSLGWENWLRLFIWLGIGLVIYFGYGVRHSRLRQGQAQ